MSEHWYSDEVSDYLLRNTSAMSHRAVQELRGAPKIRIDNVTEFYFAGTDKEEWDLSRDFPYLIPPFDKVWLETNRPTIINSSVHGSMQWGRVRPARWAVYVIRADVDPSLRNNIHPDWAKVRPILPEGSKHIVMLQLCCDTFGFFSSHILVVDEHGTPLEHEPGQMAHFWIAAPGVTADQLSATREMSASLVYPALLAMSLLNCKNVDVSEVDAPRSLRRTAKRNNAPVSKYYVLNVDVLRREVTSHAKATGNSIAKSLHICRGHFATYTDDHPLFGKYTGRFWKPSHVRGSVQSGVVVKDYRVIQ